MTRRFALHRFVSIALLPLLLFAATACTSQNDGKVEEAYRAVTDEGALVLDVRTAEEFSGGGIEGARNIPIDQLARRVSEVMTLIEGDLDKPVVVYCAAGGRAAKAKQILQTSGFTNVINLGGVSDWPVRD
jgi:phage shock protein E